MFRKLLHTRFLSLDNVGDLFAAFIALALCAVIGGVGERIVQIERQHAAFVSQPNCGTIGRIVIFERPQDTERTK
jgi:hypothetical protein